MSVVPSELAQRLGDRGGVRGPKGMPFPNVETIAGTGASRRVGLPPTVTGQGTGARCRNAATTASCRHANRQDDHRATDVRHHPESSAVRRLARLLCRRRASRSCDSPGSTPTETPAGFEEDLSSPLPLRVWSSLYRGKGHPSAARSTSPGERVELPPARRQASRVCRGPHDPDGDTGFRSCIDFGAG